jgi:hypothetical protein
MKSNTVFYILLSSAYNYKCFIQNCREYKNTSFMLNNYFFKKMCSLWGVEKYFTVGQIIYRNMTYAHCMLDTLGYK